jgi:hypothetical protein
VSVTCAVRYLHHWQARSYFRTLLFLTFSTCIIGGLGGKLLASLAGSVLFWACVTCIIGGLCGALLASLAGYRIK